MYHPKIAERIEATRWAILPESLRAITRAIDGGLTADDREFFHLLTEVEVAAFVGELGEQLDGAENAFVSGDTGILFVDGPIIPRASELSRASGLVSIQGLTADFKALEKDARVKRIILAFDSPGGDVTGISDFAAMVKASSKPTVGYVFGMCASAAYWIASATDQIVATDTAMIGGLGIVGTYRKRAEPEGVTTWEIVSSQTPKKRLDLNDGDARAVLQKNADELADVFLGSVSSNLGVDLETVQTEFGEGAVMVALSALAAGMIHEIAPFEAVMKAQAPPRNGSSVVQSLIFSKKQFPRRDDATKWARDHEFRADKVDETPNSWRLRQREPGEFSRFRTITMTEGVQAVIGPLKSGARPTPRGIALEGLEDAPRVAAQAGEKLRARFLRVREIKAKIDQIRQKRGATKIDPPACAGNKGVLHMDPTLRDLMASDPAIRSAVEAVEATAFERGRESGESQAKARIEAASPYLKKDSDYPDSVRQVALDVLAGKLEPATLQATVAAVDAVTEGQRSAAAQVDSNAEGDIPPNPPAVAGSQTEEWSGYMDDDEFLAEVNRVRGENGLEEV